MTKKKSTMYCTKTDKEKEKEPFKHFFGHAQVVKVSYPHLECIEVIVEELDEPTENSYFAWWSFEKEKFSFVFKDENAVKISLNDFGVHSIGVFGLVLPVNVQISA